MNPSQTTLLLVANWDSDVGYAWWLMESFWARLAEHYQHQYRIVLAYPRINTLPPTIARAPLQPVEQDFSGSSPGWLLAHCRFLRRNRVRILYFSDWATWKWRYALYRLCGVRWIIIHDHTPGLRTPARGFKDAVKRLIHRLPWLTVDGAIGATVFVRQRFIEVNGLPPERCFAAPNGLPPLTPPPVAADLHARFQIPVERKILVMTGRAHRYKGVDFILTCLSRLWGEGRRDLHFLFVGDGPDLACFIALAGQLGIADACTFAGRCDDVPALLESADIAIHPSSGEVGYSLSILEYMRAGLPVVVPDNPSVCGATAHEISGLVYAEGDCQSATAALRRLLDDDALRTRLGEQARIAVQQYRLDATHTALLEAFETILRPRKIVGCAIKNSQDA